MNELTALGRALSAARRRPDAALPPSMPMFGTVLSVQSGSLSTVTLATGASTAGLPGVTYLSGYSPTAGDQVHYVLIRGVPLVLGKVT